MKMQEKVKFPHNQKGAATFRSFIMTFLLSVFLFSPWVIPNTALAKDLSDWDYYQKQGHRNVQWDALVKAGFEAYETENWNAALSFLKRAKGLGCKDGLLLFKLAYYEETRGNAETVLPLMLEAEGDLRRRYPNHPVTLNFSEHVGNLLFDKADYAGALPYFLKSIEENGESFLRDYVVGQIYRMQGNSGESVAYFEKAMHQPLPPNAPPAMRVMAQVELLQLYHATEDDKKTLALAEEILKSAPNHPTALAYRDEILHAHSKAAQKKKWEEILNK